MLGLRRGDKAVCTVRHQGYFASDIIVTVKSTTSLISALGKLGNAQKRYGGLSQASWLVLKSPVHHTGRFSWRTGILTKVLEIVRFWTLVGFGIQVWGCQDGLAGHDPSSLLFLVYAGWAVVAAGSGP